MKKIIFIAIVAVASLASCKKDHTCTCTTTGSTIPDVEIFTKSKKGDARSQCLSGTYTYAASGYSGTGVRTCTFK